MMNRTKKIMLRIAAGILAIAIIITLIIVSNHYGGNPISAFIAEGRIKQYLASNYPTLNLTVKEFAYLHIPVESKTFSDGYYAQVQDDNSIDVSFSVFCYNGQPIFDNFKGMVLERGTVLKRWSTEYSLLITTLVKAKYPNLSSTSCRLFLKNYEELPTFGASLDMKAIQSATLTLVFNSSDFSPQTVSTMLIQIHDILKPKGYFISNYSIAFQNGTKQSGVFDINVKYIENGTLAEIIQDASTNPQQARSEFGINFFKSE